MINKPSLQATGIWGCVLQQLTFVPLTSTQKKLIVFELLRCYYQYKFTELSQCARKLCCTCVKHLNSDPSYDHACMFFPLFKKYKPEIERGPNLLGVTKIFQKRGICLKMEHSKINLK